MSLQGVVKSYDPLSKEGTVVTDTDRTEYLFSPSALANSVFGYVRPGQRIVFDLDEKNLAINVRTGAEGDMGMAQAQV